MQRWITAAVVWLTLAVAAQAAPTPNSVILPQTPTAYAGQILPADTTVLKTLLTAGADGSKLLSIRCSNTDTAAAYTVRFTSTVNAVVYVIAAVNIPISAGHLAGVPPVQIVNSTNTPGPVDADGNVYLRLPAAALLRFQTTTTVAAGKSVDCTAFGADY